MTIPIKYIGATAYPRTDRLLTILIVTGVVLIGAFIGFCLALQVVGSLQVTPIL